MLIIQYIMKYNIIIYYKNIWIIYSKILINILF